MHTLLDKDSSAAIRWPVDQEVARGFESHPRQKLISVVRALSGFNSSFGKMSTGFRWSGYSA